MPSCPSLGRTLEQNLLAFITFSNWMAPSDAPEAVIESGVPFQKDENNEPVHFLFNNSSFKKFDKRNETA
uniref:Uncharacterized protein n=1 Tax=Anguilla anguilla TaxID=7936 RepID=A0A0E9S6Y9_ANGAN